MMPDGLHFFNQNMNQMIFFFFMYLHKYSPRKFSFVIPYNVCLWQLKLDQFMFSRETSESLLQQDG